METTIADQFVSCPLWVDPSGSIRRDLVLYMADTGSESNLLQTTWYSDALQVMTLYGNEVLEYIENNLGEVPPFPIDNWGHLAISLVTLAVDLWVFQTCRTCLDLE